MLEVLFITFSGMTIPLRSELTRKEAFEYCKRRNDRVRREGDLSVNYLGWGEWEHVDEDGKFLIGDDQGYLMIRKQNAA